MPDEPTETDDRALLSRYVRHQSDSAFAALVRRHIDHVFSAAWRRVNGDRALAEDVTQAVFTDLARKAAALPADVVLGGWLHRHTGFTASKTIDRERRRRRREQEAATMTALHSTTDDPLWHSTAPLLDEALDQLPAADRDAVVLRFFEKHDFHAVGAALGVSDDTAQKRVARALEKLRSFLSRRGITGTAGALSAVLTAQAVTAAPASLAGSVAGSALAGAASAAGIGGWWAALTAASRWKLAGAMALVATLAAAPVVLQRRELKRLSAENRTLRERVAAAAVPTPSLAETVVGSPSAPSATAGPGTPADVIRAAAGILRGGAQDVTATTQALALLANIPAAEVQASLAEVARVADEPAQALLYKYLLGRWAETEPWKALQYVQSALPMQCRAGVFEGVVTAWAGRDPESALAWFKKATGGSAPPPARESLLATIFRGLASRDLDKAVVGLGWLSSENERAQALRGLLEALPGDADRVQLMATLNSLEDEEARLQARRAAVEMWAQRDPAAAAGFVESVDSAWERTRLMDSLGLAWLQAEPEKAADWWVSHAPGPDTLIKIMNVWAHSDANAAGAWLGRRAVGPESDPARMTFARQVADLDAESALRWAETITDPVQRESTVEHVFERWQARDAAAAQTFLQKTNWTPERVARLASERPQNN